MLGNRRPGCRLRYVVPELTLRPISLSGRHGTSATVLALVLPPPGAGAGAGASALSMLSAAAAAAAAVPHTGSTWQPTGQHGLKWAA